MVAFIALASRGQGAAVGGERLADHGGSVAPQPRPIDQYWSAEMTSTPALVPSAQYVL